MPSGRLLFPEFLAKMDMADSNNPLILSVCGRQTIYHAKAQRRKGFT
jgi:hypothetical protein